MTLDGMTTAETNTGRSCPARSPKAAPRPGQSQIEPGWLRRRSAEIPLRVPPHRRAVLHRPGTRPRDQRVGQSRLAARGLGLVGLTLPRSLDLSAEQAAIAASERERQAIDAVAAEPEGA